MTGTLELDHNDPPVPRQPAVGAFVSAIENAPPVAATRHLSAGAYVDEEFCRTAIVEVYDQSKRLVAPSYGFDLTTVLSHCLRSRRANLIRDIVIVSSLFVALVSIVGIPALFLVLITLGILQFTVSLYRFVRELIDQVRSNTPRAVKPRSGARLVVRGVLLLLGATAVIAIVFAIAGTITAALAASQVSGDSGFTGGYNGDGGYSDGSGSSGTSGTAIAVIVFCVLLFLMVFGATIGTEWWRQRSLERLAPDHGLEPQASTPRLEEIRSQEAGNVIVYSGTFPFVGSGESVSKWASALRLIKPDPDPVNPATERSREFAEAPFSARELSDYVATRLRRLTEPGESEHRIPRLIVEDQVFLAGTEMSNLSPNLPQSDVDDIIRNPTAPARHYLASRVVSWRGQLVTNVYATFALQGRTLYLEISTWALPPCRDEFRVVDDVRSVGLGARVRAVIRGFANAPRVVWRAPISIIRVILDKIARRVNASSSAFRHGFDYGARLSVRELGSAPLWEHSLHNHDVSKYSQIIERRIIADVGDFLETKGVDTSEFRARALNILNNGAMNFGGDFNMGSNNAVGPNAQAGGSTGAKP